MDSILFPKSALKILSAVLRDTAGLALMGPQSLFEHAHRVSHTAQQQQTLHTMHKKVQR